MMQFVWMIYDLYQGIFTRLHRAVFVYSTDGNVTSVASVLFACIVVGFAVSMYWKGAKAQ